MKNLIFAILSLCVLSQLTACSTDAKTIKNSSSQSVSSIQNEATSPKTETPDETSSSTPDADHEPVYYGTWQISEVKFASVSAMSQQKAEKYIGKTIIYRPDDMTDIDGNILTSEYSEQTILADEFEKTWNQGVSFKDIGFDSDSIVHVTLDQVSTLGGSFYFSPENTEQLVMIQDGVFFIATPTE